MAVLGPDGAGKSTLLRVMAGLLRPGSGTVSSALKRGALGYAGSSFDLYGDLTVAENLEFFGRLRGMDRERLEARKAAMLELTGLKDARDRLAGRLSGGMKKGLSLACALVHEPPLLLLGRAHGGRRPGLEARALGHHNAGGGRGDRHRLHQLLSGGGRLCLPLGRHGRGAPGGDHGGPGDGRERGVVGLGAAGARRPDRRCGPAWLRWSTSPACICGPRV